MKLQLSGTVYQILKVQVLSVFCLPASQPACQPAVIPGCARYMAQQFLHNKGQIYKTVIPVNIYPLHHGVSLYPSLHRFYLHFHKGEKLVNWY